MKTPARPWRGAAGEKIENKDYATRSSSIARTPRPYPAELEPSWQHVGPVADKFLAGLTVKST